MKHWFLIFSRTCVGIIFLLCFSRCVDPIEIDIPDQAPLLVVDGLLTDQPGPYTVLLSNSKGLDELGDRPVTDATVHIEEENGVVVALREVSEGTYQTDSASIRGSIGKRYRLTVKLGPEQSYQSAWVQLKAAPPIQKLSYTFGLLPKEPIISQGVRIFLDTEDAENKTHFYRWEWEATWMHIAPFASGLKFVGNDSTVDIPSHQVCFNSGESSSILLASSLGNSRDAIGQFPITTVSGFGSELRYRYSILVKQYALTEEEFLFWKRVQEANENNNSLYERQPQSTVGNLVRLEDDTEPVLGYFSVSGRSDKRMFIQRDELPDQAILGEQYLYNCFIKADTFYKGLQTEGDVFEALEGGNIFFNFFRDPDIVGWILVTRDCSDCREAGGTTEVPDFW